jgi:hypothetical protein
MKYLIWVCVASLFLSCSSLTTLPESELKSDYYHYRENGTRYEKVFVNVDDDTTTIVKIDGKIIVPNNANQKFQKRSFDIDVLVVPFKIRPSSNNFPRQLTTEFNGNIFLGYRVDRYKSHYFKTPLGTIKKFRHRAITFGTFCGIGTSSITPWTTNYRTTDEYNGLILCRGLSAMFGVNNLTVGLGLGWDYLTDRDKDIWIYQNRPWYGLAISLNIN